ncbi:enoyl-CoA hydratase/isomerase family protein [Dactylosporangium sp. CA-092794]|uniref:enoyl-CoA hydratase/isomerase family protein n=1 Tax=Dactylosporangium sp. CA-092794 TaxID=3239929 RepID=UPI003D92BDF2
MAIDVQHYIDTYDQFKFEVVEDRVLEIVFSNPGKLNAVSARGHAQLAVIWPDISADENIRAVIVRGEGRAFCAGGEMDIIDEMAVSASARLRGMRETRDIVYNIINCSKPIVSAMHGVAVGAGLCVGLLADVSIATPDVRLVDGHTRFGVPAGDGAVLIWPLLMGMAKAKYHVLTCEPILGKDAERMGVVSLCVEADELVPTARKVARRLVSGSQSAIEMTKYAMNSWLRLAGPSYDISMAYEFLGLAGDDVQEGVKALREKREPNFS